MIAQEGYWKRVEFSNIDSNLPQEKAVLYRCPPGVCLGSVKITVLCFDLSIYTHLLDSDLISAVYTHSLDLIAELNVTGTMNVEIMGQGKNYSLYAEAQLDISV